MLVWEKIGEDEEGCYFEGVLKERYGFGGKKAFKTQRLGKFPTMKSHFLSLVPLKSCFFLLEN